MRVYNRRGFSDLEKIFIFFNARYTKRDAAEGGAVSEALKNKNLPKYGKLLAVRL